MSSFNEQFGSIPGAPPEGGGELFRYRIAFSSLLRVFEPIAFPGQLDEMAPVGQPVEHCTGEPFRSEHLGPVLKGQIDGHDDARSFIRRADDVEQKLRSDLGCGHVAQFVEDPPVVSSTKQREITRDVATFQRFNKRGPVLHFSTVYESGLVKSHFFSLSVLEHFKLNCIRTRQTNSRRLVG